MIGPMGEAVTVYRLHIVRGDWRMYVGTMEEMIVQKDRTGHETKAAIVHWKDQEEADEERLPYPGARLRMCLRGREREIEGQLVPEQEAPELEGQEVSSGRRKKKKS